MVPEASESEGHEPRDGLLFSGIIALRSAMPIICRGACASQQQGGCSAGAKYGRRARVHAKVRAAAGGGGGGGGGGASSMICRCAQSKRSAAVAFLADVGPSAPAYAMQAPIIPDCAGRVLDRAAGLLSSRRAQSDRNELSRGASQRVRAARRVEGFCGGRYG